MRKIFLTLIFCLMCSVGFADEYYIGQWKWNTEIAGYWEAPQKEFLTGVIDLRSIPNQSFRGGVAKGYALFSYSQSVTDAKLTLLGDDLDETPNVTARGAIQSKLQLSNINSVTIREIIWELLTVKSDPTGNSRWKPLMPDVALNMKIRFGSEGVIKQSKLIPFESPEWETVLMVIHNDYRRLIKDEPEYKIAKMLDFLEEQYGVPYQTFIPQGYVQIASLPHETTLTESFNTADSATLGPDQTWTEIDGNFDVFSNQLAAVTESVLMAARVESNLSSSNQRSQIDITTLTGSGSSANLMGAAARFNASAHTYYAAVFVQFSGEQVRIRKVVAGSETELATTNQAFSLPDTVKVEVDGSNIKSFFNGSEIDSVTDSSITGNLRAGVGDTFIDNSFDPADTLGDNWEAADLAVVTRRIIIISRGLN